MKKSAHTGAAFTKYFQPNRKASTAMAMLHPTRARGALGVVTGSVIMKNVKSNNDPLVS